MATTRRLFRKLFEYVAHIFIIHNTFLIPCLFEAELLNPASREEYLFREAANSAEVFLEETQSFDNIVITQVAAKIPWLHFKRYYDSFSLIQPLSAESINHLLVFHYKVVYQGTEYLYIAGINCLTASAEIYRIEPVINQQ